MGHERIGMLPKTRKWRHIVDSLSQAVDKSISPKEIADRTLDAVGDRFASLANDPSVEEAFSFLLDVSLLAKLDVTTPSTPHSPLFLLKEMSARLEATSRSPETRELVRFAIGDTLAAWSDAYCESPQQWLAITPQVQPWARAATPGGFCDLTRLFFARLTTRYLNYYLEREASGAIADLTSRNQFKTALDRHVEQVTKWSFESSKIAQSYAAGWFAKYAQHGKPSAHRRRAFLTFAFEKLRSDFRRETS